MVERGAGRPGGGYKDENGNRLPSVTTILSRFKDSKALLAWAHREGAAGRPLNQKRDEAADVGGLVHEAIEDFLCDGRSPEEKFAKLPKPELISQARLAWGAFEKSWVKLAPRVEIQAIEVPLHYDGVGGTVDAIGKLDGKLAVIDWKTSNGIYADYLVQCAAYAEMWLAMRGEKAESIMICRFGKDGTSELREFDSERLTQAVKTWRHMKSLFKAITPIEELF